MKLYIFVLYIFTLNSYINCFGQNYRRQQHEIFAYNILSNGLICGFSSTFNKNEGEKALPVFVKNFGKGCLGGFIKYAAKNQTYYLQNTSNTYLAPFNRAFFFLGHSIAINASTNKRLLENYYCNFYGLNIHYKPYETKEDKIKVKLSVSTLYSLCAFSIENHKLDFYKSLEYGQFYFDMSQGSGVALFNSFGIRKYSNGTTYKYAIPHEVVHTYQAYDYFTLSGFYKERLNQSIKDYKIYKLANKYIDIDYEALFMSALFLVQPEPQYYKNFYEYEAEHFTRRSYIVR